MMVIYIVRFMVNVYEEPDHLVADGMADSYNFRHDCWCVHEVCTL